MMMRLRLTLVLTALFAACGGDSSENETDSGSDIEVGVGDATDADVAADLPTDDADPDTPIPGCEETAGSELPEGVEWLVLDGQSGEAFSLADRPLSSEYVGQFGTYDLNAEPVAGANGFYLDEPIRVLGAQARFGNAPESGLGPATLTVWPDFSSDGFAFDIENPMGTHTRCIDQDDEGEWITFAFDEPYEYTQPFHVFVGYERGRATETDGAWSYHGPELLFENFQEETEPFYSGIRWPEVDDELFYIGQMNPWYTWQVRLAIERVGTIPEPDKLYGRVGEPFENVRRYAWGDYDNDGDDDLMTSGPALWENVDGELQNVTEVVFSEALPATNGGVWGDYDNDGCLDYFAHGVVDALLRNNCDGTFTDVTVAAAINDVQETRDCDNDDAPEPSPTEASAWFDYDGDGLIDLYVANYECYSEWEYFGKYPDRLFRNAGDGTFEDVSDEMGIGSHLNAGRGLTPIDIDGDRDMDLFVSNYRLDPNLFFFNDRGEFSEEARLRGVQGTPQEGRYGHTSGTVFGDIDLDGDLDMIQANLSHPFYYHFSDLTRVYMNDGWAVFEDQAEERGIYYRETHSHPILFDADNDRDLDLFITCVYADRDSDFYENDGSGYFTLRNYESGLIVENGWGSAASDFDLDGDVDVVAGSLFERRGTPDSDWLQVRALGVDGVNAAALGATVEVDAGGVTQTRVVSGGSGSGCQDSMYLHFGLGDATEIDEVRVRFPYGDTVAVTDVEANGRLWVWSDGETATGWEWPDR